MAAAAHPKFNLRRLGSDKRILAALAVAIVLYVYLRSRMGGTGITAADTSTVPVDPTGGLLPAGSGGGGGATTSDGIQASLDSIAGAIAGLPTFVDLNGAIADNAAQNQSAIDAAFQRAQNANEATTAAGSTSTTSTGAGTPATTPLATVTSPGAPPGIPLAFTIGGGLDPAIAAGYAARHKTAPLDDNLTLALPRATQPPSPIPVNASPAPPPPHYPTPAVSGTPPPTPASIAHVNPTIEGSSTSAIASHLRYGRDPGD